MKQAWRICQFLLALLAPALPGGIAISALLLCWLAVQRRLPEVAILVALLTVANPAVFNVGAMSTLRWPLLALAIAASFTPTVKWSFWPTYWLFALAAYLLFNSAMVSALPTISLFKSVFFIALVWTLLNSRNDWTGFLYRMDRVLPIYVALNVVTLAARDISYLANGLGFQGLTNQPQAAGVVFSMFAIWLFARLWNNVYTFRQPVGWLTLLTLGGLVVLTQSRTSLATLIAGIGLVWFINFARTHSPLLVLRNLFFAGLIMGSLVGIYTQTDIIQNVIYKERIGGRRESLAEGLNSRGHLVERSHQNFVQSPIVGIGFGMPSVVRREEISYLADIPVSVKAEKGVWVSALLEEAGVLGMAFFTALLISLAALAWRISPIMLAMLVSMLISGLGENTLFSAGAVGALQWSLMFSLLHSSSQVPVGSRRSTQSVPST